MFSFQQNLTITQADIISRITGNKNGYTLKAIVKLSNAAVANILGKEITIKKAGNFFVDLILKHDTKKDAWIRDVYFQINGSTQNTNTNIFTFTTQTNDQTGISTLTITGINKKAYENTIDLVIPTRIQGKVVKAIGQNAFKDNVVIEKLTIPNTLETIGTSAFYGCYNLKEVVVGNSVKIIGSSAFQGCYNLKEVVLGNNVKTIGGSAFKDCTKLEKINLPNSLESLGYSYSYNNKGRVFSKCTNLKNITIPANCQLFSYYTSDGRYDIFYLCRQLTVKIKTMLPSKIKLYYYHHHNNNCRYVKEILVPRKALDLFKRSSYLGNKIKGY